MAELTQNDLCLMADELALKWWGAPYDGLIELKNRRWKNINGRFCAPLLIPKLGEVPPSIIQMCKKRNSERTTEEVTGTLLHELVHWRLFVCGIPHRDNDREFIQEALRVSAPISGTRKAQRAYEEYAGVSSGEE